MHFGITFPTLSSMAQQETLLRLAQLGQELAFDSIWVSAHVFVPYEMAPRYPSAPQVVWQHRRQTTPGVRRGWKRERGSWVGTRRVALPHVSSSAG